MRTMYNFNTLPRKFRDSVNLKESKLLTKMLNKQAKQHAYCDNTTLVIPHKMNRTSILFSIRGQHSKMDKVDRSLIEDNNFDGALAVLSYKWTTEQINSLWMKVFDYTFKEIHEMDLSVTDSSQLDWVYSDDFIEISLLLSFDPYVLWSELCSYIRERNCVLTSYNNKLVTAMERYLAFAA